MNYEYSINLNKVIKFSNLKIIFEDFFGILTDNQIIIYRGKAINDNDFINDVMRNNDTLVLLRKPSQYNSIMNSIQRFFINNDSVENVELEIRPSDFFNSEYIDELLNQ